MITNPDLFFVQSIYVGEAASQLLKASSKDFFELLKSQITDRFFLWNLETKRSRNLVAATSCSRQPFQRVQLQIENSLANVISNDFGLYWEFINVR